MKLRCLLDTHVAKGHGDTKYLLCRSSDGEYWLEHGYYLRRRFETTGLRILDGYVCAGEHSELVGGITGPELFTRVFIDEVMNMSAFSEVRGNLEEREGVDKLFKRYSIWLVAEYDTAWERLNVEERGDEIVFTYPVEPLLSGFLGLYQFRIMWAKLMVDGVPFFAYRPYYRGVKSMEALVVCRDDEPEAWVVEGERILTNRVVARRVSVDRLPGVFKELAYMVVCGDA